MKLDRNISIAAAVLLSLALPRANARAEPPVRLPIVMHVVEQDGLPAVTPDFIAERVARANLIFAPHGIAFVVTERRSLAAKHAAQETRADRDALARFSARGAIHCFVVSSLRDVDEPARMRRGVHWRARDASDQHYLIVSAIAGPDVLAHELGHFLGNREHSETPGNLMSYQHTEVLPFLDATQAAKLQRALQRYLRTRELVPAL